MYNWYSAILPLDLATTQHHKGAGQYHQFFSGHFIFSKKNNLNNRIFISKYVYVWRNRNIKKWLVLHTFYISTQISKLKKSTNVKILTFVGRHKEMLMCVTVTCKMEVMLICWGIVRWGGLSMWLGLHSFIVITGSDLS